MLCRDEPDKRKRVTEATRATEIVRGRWQRLIHSRAEMAGNVFFLIRNRRGYSIGCDGGRKESRSTSEVGVWVARRARQGEKAASKSREAGEHEVGEPSACFMLLPF